MDPRIQLPNKHAKKNLKKTAFSFMIPFFLFGLLFFGLVFYYYYQLRFGDIANIPTTLQSESITISTNLAKQENNTKKIKTIPIRPFNPTFGNKKNPKIKIISFIDFECPYCQQGYTTFRAIMEKYQNDVLFVFKHLPIEDLHPNSMNSAIASTCAHEQNQFFDYYDLH